MKKIIILIFSIQFFISACGTDSEKKSNSQTGNTHQSSESDDPADVNIQVMKYENLVEYLEKSTSTYAVVNFWATWCVPCVKELPYFFEIKNDSKYKDVEWIFVTLDNRKVIDSHVKEFLKKNKYTQATHILLDDVGREQKWIDVINPKWEGSIPASAFYMNGLQKDFHEGIFNKEELVQFVEKNMR